MILAGGGKLTERLLDGTCRLNAGCDGCVQWNIRTDALIISRQACRIRDGLDETSELYDN